MVSLIRVGEKKSINAEDRALAQGDFIELSNGFVHYEIDGPEDGQTLVLIPGLSVPYSIWDPTFEALVAEGYRVVRYDLYGRGFSDRPILKYNHVLFDDQLSQLLQHLNVRFPVDLIGLSLGGAISVVYTDLHPESVRKLCLIDPAGLPWPQSFKAKLGKMPLIGDLFMHFFGEKILVSNLKDYFYEKDEYSKLEEEFLFQMQFQGFKHALLSTLRNGVINNAEEAYRNVGKSHIPVLLIWGKEDQVVPFQLSKLVMHLIPHAEFHAIDKAAHLPHYEHPNNVNSILINFLNK